MQVQKHKHPLISKLVDKDTLTKMGTQPMAGAASETKGQAAH